VVTGEGTTAFVLDGDHEALEFDGATGDVQRRYIYGVAVDDIIAMREWTGSEAAYSYAHKNRLGSVIVLTDDAPGAAQVTEQHVYSPYGLAHDAADANTGFPYRYTGRRLDPG